MDKRIQMSRQMQYELKPGQLSQLQAPVRENIDVNELERLTAQLKQLGFVVMGDLVSETIMKSSSILNPPPSLNPVKSKPHHKFVLTGFGRIFKHPLHGCYVSLLSLVAISHFDPRMKLADRVEVLPFRLEIISMSQSGGNRWSFATRNSKADPLLQLVCGPYRLSHWVNVPVERLLQSHLTEREDIARRGKFQWDEELSLEKFIRFESESVDYARSFFERTNAFSVALFFFAYRFRNHEWWGKLPR
jgi:hypothetical protein